MPAPVDQGLPIFEQGDAVARLEIPTLGLDAIVVAGVDRDDLKRGPGHYPQTPLPGQLGNAAIAGHRSTYGEPFADIDKLQSGDEITVTTPAGTFVYIVDDSRIVSPSDTYVLDTVDAGASRLTLTSCHPRYSASQRIAVSAELAGNRSSPVGAPVVNYGRPIGDESDEPSVDTVPGEPVDPASTSRVPRDIPTDGTDSGTRSDTADTTATTADNASPIVTTVPTDGDSSAPPSSPVGEADAFSDGWFADRGAYPHVAIWGLVLGSLAVGGYGLCRRFRNNWSGTLLVAAPFLVALYFFYQNVNRLLPAAL
ncbi:MAG: class E sortase [Actinomycetota bacterium]|nr:class E sortase [Actinomycetota bacterium]